MHLPFRANVFLRIVSNAVMSALITYQDILCVLRATSRWLGSSIGVRLTPVTFDSSRSKVVWLRFTSVQSNPQR